MFSDDVVCRLLEGIRDDVPIPLNVVTFFQPMGSSEGFRDCGIQNKITTILQKVGDESLFTPGVDPKVDNGNLLAIDARGLHRPEWVDDGSAKPGE